MQASNNHTTWRVTQLIQTTSAVLTNNQIEYARLNAEILLGSVLGMSRVDLYLNYDRPVSEEELTRLRHLVRRRLAHEPLQYILGEAEFMSLKFHVTPDVLIPRPDTETLVEWVIERYHNAAVVRILDLGTGSGNIAISLAHYLKQAQVTGIDISLAGLQIAAENVRRHGVENQVRLIQADLTAADFAGTFRQTFDVIVSNPPYITNVQLAALAPEVADHEPNIALRQGESNGFFYHKIVGLAPALLQRQGAVFVELGFGQLEMVKNIFSVSGLNEVEIRSDLAEIPRVLLAKWE